MPGGDPVTSASDVTAKFSTARLRDDVVQRKEDTAMHNSSSEQQVKPGKIKRSHGSALPR
jgi:hypothetical protein